MNNLAMRIAPIVAFLLFAASQAFAAGTLSGRVVGVQDGDTITVLDTNNRQHKIRLAEIDAPEKRQAFGERSKQALSDLVNGKEVIVEVQDTDRYGRTVGRVKYFPCPDFAKCAPEDANAHQVLQGMAWAYRQYLKDQTLLEFEEDARTNRRGLWADPHPIPPWEFRHGGR
jgi:endonuclease YncB( thermonuclease family)